MTISVFTLFNEAFRPVADLTQPVLRDYCAKHGYLFRAFENPVVQCDIVWDRLLPLFETQADWSVYVDTDVLITNPEIGLESIITAFPNTELIIGSDIQGLNDGMLMVKNSMVARAVVDLVRSFQGAENVFCAQDGIRDLLLTSGFKRDLIAIAPQRMFNSYLYEEYGLTHEEGQWQPGDFALHLPGRTNERRCEIFSGLLKK